MKQKLITYLKAKRDPALVILEYLRGLDTETKRLVEVALIQITEKAKRKFEYDVQALIDNIPAISEEISDGIKELLLSRPDLYKGAKGERGEKGERGDRGERGEKGEPGKIPVAGIEKKSLKEKDLKLIIAKVLTNHKFKDIDVENLVRLIERLKGNKRLDYYSLKNLPSIPSALSAKKLGGGGSAGIYTSSIIVPTETPDDSRTTYTFSQKPTVIVINGTTYRENKGWTWSGLVATIANAVGTDGDIYGLI